MTTVSVIIPVYNGGRTLARAITSACVQTIAALEIIVVDDGSNDGSRTIAEVFAERDPRVVVIAREENRGVSHTRNVGLEHAQGEWIAPLDADDWMEPDRLQTMIDAAQTLGADVVFDNLLITDEKTGLRVMQTLFGNHTVARPVDAAYFFRRDTPYELFAIGYAKPVVRASFLRATGVHYDEFYELSEDFVFMAELLLKGARAFALPTAGYHYISPGGSRASQPADYALTEHKYDTVIAACHVLALQYAARMNPKALRALKRRCRLFDRLAQLRVVKRTAKTKGLMAGGREALRAAACLPFFLKLLGVRLVPLFLLSLAFRLRNRAAASINTQMPQLASLAVLEKLLQAITRTEPDGEGRHKTPQTPEQKKRDRAP